MINKIIDKLHENYQDKLLRAGKVCLDLCNIYDQTGEQWYSKATVFGLTGALCTENEVYLKMKQYGKEKR